MASCGPPPASGGALGLRRFACDEDTEAAAESMQLGPIPEPSTKRELAPLAPLAGLFYARRLCPVARGVGCASMGSTKPNYVGLPPNTHSGIGVICGSLICKLHLRQLTMAARQVPSG